MTSSPPLVEEYLSVREAAEFLKLSRPTLESWRQRGLGPRYVKLTKACRYRKIDLIEFMNLRLVETDPIPRKVRKAVLR